MLRSVNADGPLDANAVRASVAAAGRFVDLLSLIAGGAHRIRTYVLSDGDCRSKVRVRSHGTALVLVKPYRGGAVPQVSYELPDKTKIWFEIDPVDGWQPASHEDVAGRIETAIGPLVAGAEVILGKLKTIQPDGLELKFGVKVSGTANWFVAKAATEGNFEVTLTWKRQDRATSGDET